MCAKSLAVCVLSLTLALAACDSSTDLKLQTPQELVAQGVDSPATLDPQLFAPGIVPSQGPASPQTIQQLASQTLIADPCALLDFGYAADYDLFVFENLWHIGGEATGAVAVGGDAWLEHCGIGLALPMGGNPAGAGLVVGGDLTMVGGQVFHGDVHVAGALNEISTVADGQVFNPSNIVDFASAQTQAIGLSLVLAGLPATGDVVLEDYGTLRLTGTDSSLNVFFIDDLTWKSAIEVKLYAPLGSRVIINVDVVTDDIPGDHPMFGEIWMNDSADPTAFQQTIWNFSKATSLSQWGVGWKGSLLAPWAHFTYENGMLAGQLIVKTVTMTEWSAETRRFPFICDPTPCEPDCVDKACGADGCGGVCGACPEDEFCDTGICFPSCVPDCTDKACGADGCGGLCGVCLPGESCDAEVCVPTGCVPDCAGKGCGLDGCGGTCGVCAVDEACLKGGCTPGAGVCANLHLGPAKDFNLFALEGLVHIGGDPEDMVPCPQGPSEMPPSGPTTTPAVPSPVE